MNGRELSTALRSGRRVYGTCVVSTAPVGMAMTSPPPLVTPTFGAKPMLGTNPIAVAIVIVEINDGAPYR